MIIRLSSVVAVLLASNLLVPAAAAPAAKTLMVKAPPLKLEAMASSMPVWFEPNRGQVGGRTEWTSRAAGAWLFLTSNEVVYALPPEIKFDPAKTRGVPSFKTTNVHMRMVGGRRVKGVGEGAMGSYSNYFVGKHEDEWFTGVPHFERVRYAGVYPGIDLVYYATGRSVEYDFLVAPGADPSVIELAFDGELRLDADGDLVVSAGGKSFRQRRLRVFQGEVEIEASYRLTERGTVKVEVSAFDPLVSLRVDPVLDFATYLGGPGEDYMSDVAVAPDGNLVLVGSTQSPQAPTLDPFQQPSVVSLAPIVLKMSGAGNRLLFYSVVGNGGWNGGTAVCVHRDGTIVIGGSVRSANFPVKNAFQSELKAAVDNGFVTRFSADGRSLVHSSYLGGSVREQVNDIALDTDGEAYIVGSTDSGDFPLVNPIQTRYGGGNGDGFIARVGNLGNLRFSSPIGGAGLDSFFGVTWRSDLSLVVVGQSNGADFPLKDPIQSEITPRNGLVTAILLIVDTRDMQLRYSTFLGGPAVSAASGVAVDQLGRILVAGLVYDRSFLLRNPLYGEFLDGQWNGFFIRAQPDGKSILTSTFLPGTNPSRVCASTDGNTFIGGGGTAALPLKDSLQEFRGGGVSNSDLFVIKLAPDDRAIAYSTVLGGSGHELFGGIVCDNKGVTVVGSTLSGNFPIKAPYQRESGGSRDGVLARVVDDSIQPTPTFNVSPGNLTFQFVQSGPSPPAARVSVSGLTSPAIVETKEPWLLLSPRTLTSAGTLTVSISATLLSPGISRGTIQITPAVGTAVSVPVTATVLAAAPVLRTVEPARIAVGSADTEIILRGAGFSAQTVVLLNTIPWNDSQVRVVDTSTIRLTLPRPYLAKESNLSFAVRNPNSAISEAAGVSVGGPYPSIAPSGIVSAASFVGGVISPGEIVTIFGENFEQGMHVLFDRVPAIPLYVTPTQMSVTVPYAISGAPTVEVIVEASLERRSVPVSILVWPARPALFTAASTGKGQGAILNQDGSVNSVGNPAAKGSIVVLYGTGGGPLNGTLLELPVKVYIDGIDCEILYAGAAPGLVQGAVQVNVRVPEFAVNGEVVLRVGERESQAGVIVALR